MPAHSLDNYSGTQLAHCPSTAALNVCVRHFGAEVIKVEPPHTGDALRVWRELDVDGTGPWFRSLARNKKSVTIDMRKEEGRQYVYCVLYLLSDTPTHFKSGLSNSWRSSLM